MTPSLVFYDGDGGGLCGQLRNRFELHIISCLVGIPVYDAYPYMHHLFRNISNLPGGFSLDRAVLYDDIISECDTFEDVIDYLSVSDANWVLSGRHHYTDLFKAFLKRTFTANSIVKSYRSFFSCLGSSPRLLSRRQDVIYGDYISLHVRTMVDSPSGNQLWLSRRTEFYGWLASQLVQHIDITTFPTQIFIACDCLREIKILKALCQSYGFDVHLGSTFNHTSMGRYFGSDLFVKTTDISYQSELVCRQSGLCNDLAWLDKSTIDDLIVLSQSSSIIATESTYSQMAFVIGRESEYCCFGYNSAGNALLMSS